MLKKVLYFLLAASLIAMAVFSFTYNAWGMVLSAIVAFVLIVICIWIWLGECDFESPNVHHRNLFE